MMYKLHLLLTSHKSLQGNLQDIHKLEMQSKCKFLNVFPHMIYQMPKSQIVKYESHTATND